MSSSPLRLLITAGPTHEPLDPVRYLGNRSSGKMGYALAAAAAAQGWQVTLITGPTALTPPENLHQTIPVQTAEEMAQATKAHFAPQDIIICAAAVADWTPIEVAPEKLKKEQLGDHWTIKLKRSPDILGSLRTWGFQGLLVGFAAETNNLATNAQAKLQKKGANLIIANDVSRSDIGFSSPHNELQLFWQDPSQNTTLPKASKEQLAQKICQNLSQALKT